MPPSGTLPVGHSGKNDVSAGHVRWKSIADEQLIQDSDVVTKTAVRRDYQGVADLPALMRFGQRIWTIDNRWHIGDLAWDIGSAPDGTDQWRIAIWERAGGIVGVGWLTFPDQLSLVLGPYEAHLTDDIVAWADDLAGTQVTVVVLDTETWLVDALVESGYSADLDGKFFLSMARDLSDLPPMPPLPHGYVVRSVRADEIAARAALHRAVWDRSTMSDDEYAAMAGRWPYRSTFDLVAQAPNGTLVSYILGPTFLVGTTTSTASANSSRSALLPRSGATACRARSALRCCTHSGTPVANVQSSTRAAMTTIRFPARSMPRWASHPTVAT
jgi:hypothetical protein